MTATDLQTGPVRVVPPAIQQGVQIEDVLLHDIGGDRWRVLDGRVPSDHVDALLGFVEVRGDCYEVAHRGRPLERDYHCTLEGARCAFGSGAGPATGPITI